MSYIAHTHHVQERASQRSISSQEVDQTLRYPDYRQHIAGSKYKFFKYLNGRTIVVVANSATKPLVVVTTWSKPGKYSPRKNQGWGSVDRFVWNVLKRTVSFFYHLLLRRH